MFIWLQKGGPLMYLLLSFSFVGTSLVIFKILQFVFDRTFSRFVGTVSCSTQSKEAEAILARYDKGLGLMASLAHLSPLVGLLGTILGMIQAFQNLEQSGMNVHPGVLAGGIWEALLTTAFGLGIAIVLMAFHHWFSSRVDKMQFQMQNLLVGSE